jgi:hypothetical protein
MSVAEMKNQHGSCPTFNDVATMVNHLQYGTSAITKPRNFKIPLGMRLYFFQNNNIEETPCYIDQGVVEYLSCTEEDVENSAWYQIKDSTRMNRASYRDGACQFQLSSHMAQYMSENTGIVGCVVDEIDGRDYNTYINNFKLGVSATGDWAPNDYGCSKIKNNRYNKGAESTISPYNMLKSSIYLLPIDTTFYYKESSTQTGKEINQTAMSCSCWKGSGFWTQIETGTIDNANHLSDKSNFDFYRRTGSGWYITSSSAIFNNNWNLNGGYNQNGYYTHTGDYYYQYKCHTGCMCGIQACQ